MPNSGGAKKMCEEFNVDLITKIPLDPKLLDSCDKGKCYLKEYPESKTSEAFLKIAETVINKCKK